MIIQAFDFFQNMIDGNLLCHILHMAMQYVINTFKEKKRKKMLRSSNDILLLRA